MTPEQLTPSSTADPYASLLPKLSEQDWRNHVGLLQVRLKELEQRFADLEAQLKQADRERRDAETTV